MKIDKLTVQFPPVKLSKKPIKIQHILEKDTYLQTLLDKLLKHYKLSKADVYRMLFGTELEASKNLNRPLSKLKRDILTEIGILKDGNF